MITSEHGENFPEQNSDESSNIEDSHSEERETVKELEEYLKKTPEERGENERETTDDAETYLRQKQKAERMLKEFRSSEELYDGKPIFHEVYLVGEVRDWHPKGKEGEWMGYGIFPLDDPLRPEESGSHSAEVVAFESIGGLVPKKFDIVHVKRVGSWAGKRISIEIIKQEGESN